MIDTIYNWTAVRSGAKITVHGQAASGAPRRLVNIDNIHPHGGKVVAQRHGLGGGEWVLSMEPLPVVVAHVS